MNAPGAYAEYVVWPEDSLPRVPDGLSYEAGALAEPLAVALHAVNMAGVKPGDVVFIAGGGPIGVLVHLLVRLAGAGRIIVSDLHPERLAAARAFGADVVVDAGREDPVEVVRELTGGSGADVAIEAVGFGVTRAPDHRRRPQLGHRRLARQQRAARSRSTCRPSSRAISSCAARTA